MNRAGSRSPDTQLARTGSPTRRDSLILQDALYQPHDPKKLPPTVIKGKLHHCLKTYDACAFRHELCGNKLDPNEKNADDLTCLDQALASIEFLITRSICTSHIVEKEEGPRIGQTLKNLRSLISMCKMLVQDPRTLAPKDKFLHAFPPPYFLLAVIKSACEDYKNPTTGATRDASNVLEVNKLMAEILQHPTARHHKHVAFLSAFPACIRTTIELIGRERFEPDAVAAQRFMHMSFVFNEPELFKCAAMTPELYKPGNLCNWDEVLSVLQRNPDKFRDFYFALLSSKLRGGIRREFAEDIKKRSSYNIPVMHVSHTLMEATRDVFGEEVAQCAVRLRQRYLRPVAPNVGKANWKHHSAKAEELAEMSWKDVRTAIRQLT